MMMNSTALMTAHDLLLCILCRGCIVLGVSLLLVGEVQCDFRFDLFFSFSFVPVLSNLLTKTLMICLNTSTVSHGFNAVRP